MITLTQEQKANNRYTQYASTYMLKTKEQGGPGLTPVEYVVWQHLNIHYRLYRNSAEKVHVYRATYEQLAEEIGRGGRESIKKTCQALQKKGVLYQVKVMNSASYWIPVDPSDQSYYEGTIAALNNTEDKRDLAKSVATGEITKEEFKEKMEVLQPKKKKPAAKAATAPKPAPAAPKVAPAVKAAPAKAAPVLNQSGDEVMRLNKKGEYELQLQTIAHLTEITDCWASLNQWVNANELANSFPHLIADIRAAVAEAKSKHTPNKTVASDPNEGHTPVYYDQDGSVLATKKDGIVYITATTLFSALGYDTYSEHYGSKWHWQASELSEEHLTTARQYCRINKAGA